MLLFVIVLHILLCFLLMLVILLQPGKGADIGAAFGGGGGSSTIFGPRGPASLLSRATTVVAVLFMVTSVTLAIYSNESVRSGSDVQEEIERLQKEEDARMREKMKDLWQQMDEESKAEELETEILEDPIELDASDEAVGEPEPTVDDLLAPPAAEPQPAEPAE